LFNQADNKINNILVYGLISNNPEKVPRQVGFEFRLKEFITFAC